MARGQTISLAPRRARSTARQRRNSAHRVGHDRPRQPTYVVLRAEPGVDVIRALRMKEIFKLHNELFASQEQVYALQKQLLALRAIINDTTVRECTA